MGPWILRAETAAIAALSIIRNYVMLTTEPTEIA
jgi:16S rRNA U1498 N3-methylase RsmE